MSRRLFPVLLIPLLALLTRSSTLSAQTLLTTEFAGTVATDFDAACIAPGDTETCFGGGPVAVGANGFSVTYSANYTFAAYGRLNAGFGSNGNWLTKNGVSTSSLSNDNIVSLAFSSSVTHIGAFMNYEPNASVTPLLRAYNALDELIASFALDALAPISTPGLNDASRFRGIEYAGGIRRLELSGSNLAAMDFVVRAGGAPVPVPEPKAWALLLLAVPLVRRRGGRERSAHMR
jgi:hypothetical protein